MQIVLTGYETPKQVGRPRIYHERYSGLGQKRPPGRPRIHPIKPQTEKRPRGRPRVHPVRPKLKRPRGRPPKNWKPLERLMCSTPTPILGPVTRYDFCASSDEHNQVLKASISDDGKSSFISHATLVNRECHDDDSRRSTSSTNADSNNVTDEERREFNWSEVNTTGLPVKMFAEHSDEINTNPLEQ